MVGQMPLGLGVYELPNKSVKRRHFMIHFILSVGALYLLIPLEYLLNILGISLW